MRLFSHYLNDQSGSTAIEYALIASAMAMALVAALPFISSALQDRFSAISTNIRSGT
jgi:pilus assembly protein Flp/PilA